ncbi:hypothetical protein M3Y94_01181100 [Aphelenchoides besseyi]|nr:hypothetical protein M3Y94_01181100 [Aphelenchoides besseyi]
MFAAEDRIVLFLWSLIGMTTLVDGSIESSNRPDSLPSSQLTYFPFSQKSTFVRLSLDIPLNFTNVYGKIEAKDSSWFVLFEIDHSLIPSTFPTINEDIQAGDLFNKCSNFDATREIEFELELHSRYVRIRSRNSERYDFPEPLALGRELSAEFYVQETQDGHLCTLDVRVEQKEQSRFLIMKPTVPTNSFTTNEIPPENSSYAIYHGIAATVDRKSSICYLQNATTKQNHNETHRRTHVHRHSKGQRSLRSSSTIKEINSVWSYTFLFFLTLEVIVIGAFVVFGLTMFIVLQIRPRGKEKHIAIID